MRTKLNFPNEYDFRFKKSPDGKVMIFDELRKKWLILTPEEWVRQNWLRQLEDHYKYPKSILVVEHGIKVYNTQKRSDIVVYKNSKPFILIECKRPSIELNEKTLQQAINYNSNYQCEFIVITNGMEHFFFQKSNDKQLMEQKKDIPFYN